MQATYVNMMRTSFSLVKHLVRLKLVKIWFYFCGLRCVLAVESRFTRGSREMIVAMWQKYESTVSGLRLAAQYVLRYRL